MWNIFRFGFNSNEIKKENTVKAFIQPVDNKFGIFAGNELVGTYSRRRDAVRGVARRGLTLVEA